MFTKIGQQLLSALNMADTALSILHIVIHKPNDLRLLSPFIK